jgi:hypothetical protein
MKGKEPALMCRSEAPKPAAIFNNSSTLDIMAKLLERFLASGNYRFVKFFRREARPGVL